MGQRPGSTNGQQQTRGAFRQHVAAGGGLYSLFRRKDAFQNELFLLQTKPTLVVVMEYMVYGQVSLAERLRRQPAKLVPKGA